MPLVLKTPTDYDEFDLGDELIIKNAVSQLDRDEITMENISNGKEYTLLNNFSPLEKNLILAGGKINYIKVRIKSELSSHLQIRFNLA